MGAQNIAKVFANWPHLSHREARAQLFLALVSLDADNPPVYFGGWEALAHSLGLGAASSSKRMTMQTLAALREAGAIVSSGQARMNVRAEYALALESEFTFKPQGTGRSVAWVKVPREIGRVNEKDTHVGERKRHPAIHEKDTHQGEPKVQNRVNQKDTPRRTEEPQGGIQEETWGGIPITNQLSLTNARARELEVLTENLSLEDERNRQLTALEKLPGVKERKAS